MDPVLDVLLTCLPGTYLLGLGVALLCSLRRWFDPVPRRVGAGFLLLVGLLLGSSLFGGRILLPLDSLLTLPPLDSPEPVEPENPGQTDLVLEVAPNQLVARRAVARGEWPLWNPWVGAGMPFLADPQAHAQVFEPLSLLALPVPFPRCFAVIAGLRVLLALVFSYLLFRRLGRTNEAASFAAVSYALGGFLLLWLGWPIANSAALLPVLLYALAMTIDRGARRDAALCALAWLAVLLGGHPETILYVVVVAAIFCLLRILATSWRERRRAAFSVFGAGLIGGLVAAPVLLPTLDYLPETHRNRLVERRNERLAALDPLEGWRSPEALLRSLEDSVVRVIPVVTPNRLGNATHGGSWAEGEARFAAAGFVGTIALVLYGAALAPRAGRYFGERAALLGAAGIVVVLARPPGLPHLFAALPLLDRSASHHARLTLVLAFLLVYVAACSLDRWREGKLSRRALMGAAAACTGAAVSLTLVAEPPIGYEDLEALRWGSLGLQIGLVVSGALALVSLRSKPWRRAVIGALTVLAAAELLFFFGGNNTAAPRRLGYPATPSLAFLESHLDGHRTVGLGDALRPNLSSVYGLSDPRLSNPAKPWVYSQLTAPLSRSVRDITDEFLNPFDPLYQLLGVRYLMVRERFAFPSKPPWSEVYRGDGVVIYEREPLPVLFLPRSSVAAKPRWVRQVQATHDFQDRALVAGPSAPPHRWRAARPEASTIVQEERTSDRIEGRALLVEPRLLATSIFQDGGWRVLIDGQPAGDVRTNAIFVGAWIEAGEHRLDLVYRPPLLLVGCILAGLALACGLSWWAAPPYRT